MLTVHTLASGSEGNCLLVSAGGTHLLVDAGISARRICGALQALALSPSDISGVLLTHEHTDHICGAGDADKAAPSAAVRQPWNGGSPVPQEFLRVGCTACHSEGRRFRHRERPDRPYSPPAMTPRRASIFAWTTAGPRIGILTDTGFVTPEAEQTLAGVDLMVLESNHDEEWLLSGPYPYYLKQRILGARGHLSNAAAGAFARRLAEGGTRQFVLAHLSRENNTPAAGTGRHWNGRSGGAGRRRDRGARGRSSADRTRRRCAYAAR